MSDNNEMKDMVEMTTRMAGDRERFRRRKTIQRKGLDSVGWLEQAVAHQAKKSIEMVIEAKLLLTTDEEEEIFDIAVSYTEPLDQLPLTRKERKELEQENDPIIYGWEEFSRHIGLEIADLLIQTGRHGRIKISIVNDGPSMDDQGAFMDELQPWYESPLGKKQVEIFLRKEQEKDQPKTRDDEEQPN